LFTCMERVGKRITPLQASRLCGESEFVTDTTPDFFGTEREHSRIAVPTTASVIGVKGREEGEAGETPAPRGDVAKHEKGK